VRLQTGLQRAVVVTSITKKLVALNITPHVPRCNSVRVNVLSVGLTVTQDEIPGAYFLSVNLPIAHAFLQETIILANHIKAHIWFNIPLGKSVCDLTEPNLTANQLRVHSIVSDDIHIVPVPIEQVMVPLVVHSHLD